MLFVYLLLFCRVVVVVLVVVVCLFFVLFLNLFIGGGGLFCVVVCYLCNEVLVVISVLWCSRVSPARSNQAVSSEAYLLFYELTSPTERL